MKFLNNTKKTRFKLALALEAFMGFALIKSMGAGMEDLAKNITTAMLTIGSTYILGDSYRKSDNIEKNKSEEKDV